MLDKNPFLGGMLNISGGHISGANSKLQIAKVIEDSPADHYRDAMRIERWACNNIGKNVCKKRLSVFKLSEAVIKALHWIIQKQ